MKGLMAPAEQEEEIQEGAADGPQEEVDEEVPAEGEPQEGAALEEQASETENAQYEALLRPVIDLLHGSGAEKTLAKLKAGKARLADTIGEMAAHIIFSVEQQIRKGGGKIEDAVKIEIGKEIVQDLVEVAAAAALVEETDEAMGALFEEAMLNAIGMYGDLAAKAGYVDRGAAKQQLGQMVQGNDSPIAKNVAAMLQQGGGAPAGGQPAPQGGVA